MPVLSETLMRARVMGTTSVADPAREKVVVSLLRVVIMLCVVCYGIWHTSSDDEDCQRLPVSRPWDVPCTAVRMCAMINRGFNQEGSIGRVV
jgi:hypothetical protein